MICKCCNKKNEHIICDDCRAQLVETAKETDRNLIDILLDALSDLPSPEKEYMLIEVLRRNSSPHKALYADWFITHYPMLVDVEWRNPNDIIEMKAYTMLAFASRYQYEEAEKIANILRAEKVLSSKASLSLAEYYLMTRRYKDVTSILNSGEKNFKKEITSFECYEEIRNKAELFKEGGDGKHKEYLPCPKENKEEIRKKYLKFVETVTGSKPKGSAKSMPTPIGIDKYPALKSLTKPNFDSFVAFDFETTGLNPARDAIIEIGAVKVINGKVSTATDCIFQEFVHPLKKRVSEDITKITGIKQDDVENARPIWEVFPDFMDFAGDLPLVGFNNKLFDNDFMVRAGRYSNLIVTNPTFDALVYAWSLGKKNLINPAAYNLTDLGAYFRVRNPQAHRALADALTTAKVLIKLKELDN